MGKTFEDIPPVERSAFIREVNELCKRYELNEMQVSVGLQLVSIVVPLPNEVTKRLIAEARMNSGLFHSGGTVGVGQRNEPLMEPWDKMVYSLGGPTITALGPHYRAGVSTNEQEEQCGICGSVIAYNPLTGSMCSCLALGTITRQYGYFIVDGLQERRPYSTNEHGQNEPELKEGERAVYEAGSPWARIITLKDRN